MRRLCNWLVLVICVDSGCGPTGAETSPDTESAATAAVEAAASTADWQSRADALFKNGDVKGAIAIYDTAIAAKSDVPEILLHRSAAQYSRAEYASARKDLEAVLRIRPNDARAWNGVGDCAFWQQDYFGAVDALTKAIDLGRRPASVYASRGVANYYANKPREAIADLNEAVRLAPQDSEIRGKRASTLLSLGDYAPAILDLDVRLADVSTDSESWMRRAECYQKLGYMSRAVADVEEAIEHSPERPLYYAYMASLYLGMHDYPAAAEWSRRAIEIDAKQQGIMLAPVSLKLLSDQDLEHGRAQVTQMLRDRPMLAEKVREGDALWTWAVRRFAGEATSGRLRWDNEAPAAFDAESVLPESANLGAVRVGASEMFAPREGQPKSFGSAWCSVAFECFNHVVDAEFAEHFRKISAGEISATEFARLNLETEERTLHRTRQFFCDVFLPWAQSAQVERVDPYDWYLYAWTPIDTTQRDSHFRKDARWDYYLASGHEALAYNAYEKENTAAAIRYIDAALAESSQSSRAKAQLWFLRSKHMNAAEDPDGVVAALSEAIRYDPNFVDALVERGVVYGDRQSFDDAFTDLNSAIRLAPDNPIAYGHRGNYWYALRNWDQAILDYGRTIEFSPNDGEGYFARAAVWGEKSNEAQELVDLRKGVELAPNRAAAHYRIAEICVLSTDEKIRNGKSAIEAATKACESSSWEDIPSVLMLAAAHAEAGNRDEAVKWQKKAAEMTPEANRGPVEAVIPIYEAGKTLRDAPQPPKADEQATGDGRPAK